MIVLQNLLEFRGGQDMHAMGVHWKAGGLDALDLTHAPCPLLISRVLAPHNDL